MRVMISGGGTGGHVYPALAVVEEIRKTEAGASGRETTEFIYFGRSGAIEERLAGRAGIPFHSINVGGIRGLAPWTAARNAVRLFQAVVRVQSILRSFKPSALLATGGYVSAPVIWAAAWERIPSVIYLPDLEPGWAIRATARWATRVAVSFPEVTKYFDGKRVVVTGYPVRARFFQTERGEARRAFHLEPEQQTVTVVGGSRGAHHINQAVVARLCDLARATQLVHVTGTEDEAWVKAEVQRLPDELRGRVRVFGYLDEDLPDALAAADVIVARAGAAVLGEFPALGVPAILVPYPFAGRHQEMNCRYLADRGAAICVQDALVTQDLVKEIKALLDEPRRLEHMRDASRSLAQPDAARRLATLVRTVAREGV